MWPVLRAWLLRNVLALLGWGVAAASVAAVLLGARQAGREFLAMAADELDHLPPDSAIEQILTDYQVVRDQARACETY